MGRGANMFKIFAAALVLWPLCAKASQVVVRVQDPSGSHCIDATTDAITLHVRRIFTQKTSGLFTQDARAGVLVSATMTGSGSGSSVQVKTLPSH